MTIQPGEHINAKYQVLEVIARGGMGELFRALRLRDGMPVVLKAIRPSLRGLSEAMERFRREATMTASVDSEHVVRVLEVVEDEALGPVIALEYLRGESLDQVLKRRGTLSMSETFPIVGQVLEGLRACHDVGIVHRDLKPGNVFLADSDDGGAQRVKLIDFGTGKMRRAPRDTEVLTKAGQNLGTFAYMSPEQSLAPSEVDERTDLYATGVLTFRMLTGQLPYEAANVPQMILLKQQSAARRVSDLSPTVGVTIPTEVDDFIAALLARNPEERPRTAADAKRWWQALAFSFDKGED